MKKSLISINGSIGLIGINIPFINEEFYCLKVGDSVFQIGDGRENGSIRTDFFKVPVKYEGAIICKFKEEEKMYAFKLPEVVNGENIYLLYGDTGLEIFTEVATNKQRTRSYMRFYKPVFKVL